MIRTSYTPHIRRSYRIRFRIRRLFIRKAYRLLNKIYKNVNKEYKTLAVTEWLLVEIMVEILFAIKSFDLKCLYVSTGSTIRYRNLITVTILTHLDGQAEILENINIYLQ